MLAPAAQAACTNSTICPVATINGFSVSPATGTVPLGGSVVFNVTVTSVTISNTVCSGTGTGTVNLSFANNGPLGITGALPASLTLNFQASAAGAGATTATGMPTAPVQFAVTALASAPAKHDHTYQLNATFTTTPASCSNTAASGGPDTLTPGAATASVAITTGLAKGNSTTTPPVGCVGATCTTTPAATTKASPLADVPTVALMMLAVAFVVSRRQP